MNCFQMLSNKIFFIFLGLIGLLISSAVAIQCEAGEYSSNNNTVCIPCERGKYAPQLGLVDSCIECDAGKYASNNKSVSCTSCKKGWSSISGSVSCELAVEYYYLDSDISVSECPNHAQCAGGTSVPVPNPGYWIDRSDYQYVGNVFHCVRDTCVGGNHSSLCWHLDHYNNSISNQCNDDELQCDEGSKGPLCGSCVSEYIYKGVMNECVECARNVKVNVTILLISLTVIIVAFFFRSMISGVKFSKKFKRRMSPLRIFSFLDSGSLKVVWVTYQIIASASYTLNIKFPQPFRSMLSVLSYFSLDFLSYECAFSHLSTEEAYFNSIYMFCCIPLMFAVLVIMTGFLRYSAILLKRPKMKSVENAESKNVSKTENESKQVSIELNEKVVSEALSEDTIPLHDPIGMKQDDQKIVMKSNKLTESEWLKVKNIINQHCFILTFIIFVVLPPLSNKQFQIFDCIEVNDLSVLRVDTLVSCDSKAYHTFRNYITFLLVLYQSIPIIWFIVLFMKREALNPSILTQDKQLAVYIRDHSSSLAPLRFLFFDYKCNKWWFEVVDMYRRIMFIAVIPLVSSSSATRASLSCILAILSIGFYREEEPFGVKFTNHIAHIAQYAILVTYYFALSHSDDNMFIFGLSSKGDRFSEVGLCLVMINVLVIWLSLWYGWTEYKEHMQKKEDKENMATQYEDARKFSEVKFKTTFEAIWVKSIPSSYALVFCYISLKDAKLARKSGLRANKKFGGIVFSLRQPHATTQADFDVFADEAINSSSQFNVPVLDSSESGEVSRPFPNQIVLVLSLQQQFLEPLPGYEQDEGLCMISVDVLHALRPTSFTAVLDEKPWIHGIALLPPSNILRSYLIMDRKKESMIKEGNEQEDEDDDDDDEDEDDEKEDDSTSRRRTHEVEDNVVMDVSLLEHHKNPCDKVLHVTSSSEFVEAMTSIRERASTLNLIPLYHYTSAHIAPIILKTGLRMSSHGQGDGGVYVSTLGPALYGLGTDQFEINIIKDCFGVERIDEYKNKGKLDVVFVYGCCGKVLEQTPGGRDNARMFSKSTFASFSLESKTGNYFLRPDRILGCFQFDHSKTFPITPESIAEIEFEYKREIEGIARVKRAQHKLKQNSNSIGATLTKIWKKQHVGLGKTVVGLNKTVSGIGDTVVGLGESMVGLSEKLALNMGKQIVGMGDQYVVRSISKTISGDLFTGKKKVTEDTVDKKMKKTVNGDDEESDEEDNMSKTSLDLKVELELDKMEKEREEKAEADGVSVTSSIKSASKKTPSKSSKKAQGNKAASGTPSWRRALTTSLDTIPIGTPLTNKKAISTSNNSSTNSSVAL